MQGKDGCFVAWLYCMMHDTHTEMFFTTLTVFHSFLMYIESCLISAFFWQISHPFKIIVVQLVCLQQKCELNVYNKSICSWSAHSVCYVMDWCHVWGVFPAFAPCGLHNRWWIDGCMILIYNCGSCQFKCQISVSLHVWLDNLLVIWSHTRWLIPNNLNKYGFNSFPEVQTYVVLYHQGSADCSDPLYIWGSCEVVNVFVCIIFIFCLSISNNWVEIHKCNSF